MTRPRKQRIFTHKICLLGKKSCHVSANITLSQQKTSYAYVSKQTINPDNFTKYSLNILTILFLYLCAKATLRRSFSYLSLSMS